MLTPYIIILFFVVLFKCIRLLTNVVNSPDVTALRNLSLHVGDVTTSIRKYKQ